MIGYLSYWQEAGFKVNYGDDLNTEAEKKLGQLVQDKYVGYIILTVLTTLLVLYQSSL